MPGLRLAGKDAAIELVNDACDVGAGFAVGRNAVILVHRVRACVIGGQRQSKVVVVAREQSVEIGRAAAHVLFGLKAVV